MRKLQANSLYRHFKGNLYYVIGEAIHSETEEKQVVYHTLYGDRKLYVRPMKMFLSEVEEGKDNPANQKFRFECVDS